MSPMRPKSGKPSFKLIIIYFQIIFLNLIISLVEICGYNSYFSERALSKKYYYRSKDNGSQSKVLNGRNSSDSEGAV